MKKALLVDDNPVVLKYMSALLKNAGYYTETAGDGLKALETLKNYRPDVIISDMIMPNISGEKLCRVVRSTPELADVKLIILSAVAVEEEIDHTHLGVDACIAKGRFAEMGRNTLEVLDQLFNVSEAGTREKGILGRERIYERTVTKELLESSRHFETILWHMAQGILEITGDGKIVFANPAAFRILGKSEAELLGSHVNRLFDAAAMDRLKPLIDSADSDSTAAEETLHFNDRQIAIQIIAVHQKKYHSQIVILTDITERQRLLQQLQQAQRMESIGTLAGGIAHDFNNLLMGIQGNTSLLMMDANDPQNAYLNKIQRLIKSGAKLTGQLLGYARKGKYEPRIIDLNSLVRETADMFRHTKRQISVFLDLAEDLHWVEADAGQMEQVLLNLFVNAWQAMPAGGRIFVTTANRPSQSVQNEVHRIAAGDYVALTVQDEGIGMDSETIERIFDPFFTTKSEFRATGLGLSSAYGIVQNHGGHIKVASRIGKGSTFSIFLPAAKDQPAGRPPPPTGAVGGSETILLVDDEPMVLESSAKLLEALGYTVITAPDGPCAVKRYQELPDKIDLVILDLIMPDFSGAEVYEAICAVNPKAKFLFCSGYSPDAEITSLLPADCCEFIQKPFNMLEMSLKIRDIIGQGRGRR